MDIATRIPSTEVLKVAPNGFVDKIAWTPVRDRKILFARSHGQELFYCAGGKREQKPDGTMETDLEALIREVREETKVTLIAATIRHRYTFEGPCHGYVAGTVLRMACYESGYSGSVRPQNEIAQLAWFTTADKHRTTKMGQDILDWHAAQNLIR